MADCSLKRLAIDDDFLQQLRGVFKGAGGLSFWRRRGRRVVLKEGDVRVLWTSFIRGGRLDQGGRQEQKKDDQALHRGLREAGLKM
jgi:hypothetical protein